MEYHNKQIISMLKVLFMMILMIMGTQTQAQLSSDFYAESCPSLFPAVRRVMQRAVAKERRMAASLLRLFFHDCFINVRLLFFLSNEKGKNALCLPCFHELLQQCQLTKC